MDLDLPERDMLVLRAKRQLRGRMRALRNALPAESRARRSAAIVERVRELACYSGAEGVALFYPLVDRGEVDVRPLDADVRGRGHAVYYPGMDEAGQPVFRPALPGELADAGRGFLEPPAGRPRVPPGAIQLVVVPALAMDASGHRLGYGSGFYDRVLDAYGPGAVRVIVGYDFQLLVEVPVSDHDLPGHWVVTDERVIEVPPSR